MTKKIIAVSTIIGVAITANTVLAEPDFPWLPAQLNTPGVQKQLVNLPLPADNSPVISLGFAPDPQSQQIVEGYAIVHYAKGGPSKGKGGENCYEFLAKDAKWKSVEPWTTNPTNTRGLDGNFVFGNLSADISKWESAAGADILGDGTATSGILIADTVSPDGRNEVYFADVADSNAIAVTVVWGIFGGPLSQRTIVEWDQVYDEVDFDWSSSGEAGKMDFENIATHELGHSVGLGDLYNSGCLEETMYGYATEGEIKKRDLNAGDIAGIQKLY